MYIGFSIDSPPKSTENPVYNWISWFYSLCIDRGKECIGWYRLVGGQIRNLGQMTRFRKLANYKSLRMLSDTARFAYMAAKESLAISIKLMVKVSGKVRNLQFYKLNQKDALSEAAKLFISTYKLRNTNKRG